MRAALSRLVQTLIISFSGQIVRPLDAVMYDINPAVERDAGDLAQEEINRTSAFCSSPRDASCFFLMACFFQLNSHAVGTVVLVGASQHAVPPVCVLLDVLEEVRRP